MEKENEIRIIAYALWAQDGYNRRSAVKHWLKAETIWQQNRQALPGLNGAKIEGARSAGDTAQMLLPAPGA
jgi:hypothetical protein